MKRLALVLLLTSIPLVAESKPHRLLRWSWTALLAGNACDTASSWGRPEANPILGERFGARSAAIKFGITGALILTQHVIVRRRSELATPFAVGNMAAGAALGGVAFRNSRLGGR